MSSSTKMNYRIEDRIVYQERDITQYMPWEQHLPFVCGFVVTLYTHQLGP